MVRSILFLLLYLSGFLATAQTGTGQITGKVVESGPGTAVDFAVVTLTSASGLQKNSMTQNGGKFAFPGLPPGIYHVRVSFIGYITDSIRNIRLGPSAAIPPLTIALRQNSQRLNEVTISETGPLVSYEADRLTYHADQSLLSEGSVATDLLKNVPMVDVDPDGKPTIAGKRNTRIFINGKPSDFTSEGITDLLNVLPSDAVMKIEVISSPPAKYSADGDGIINIELKKDFKLGLTGSLAGTGNTRGNYNGSGFLNYRAGGLKLTGNAAIRRNIRQSNGSSFRETFTPDTTYFILQSNTSRGQTLGRNLRTSLDWDLTPLQNLRISVNLNGNSSGSTSTAGYEYTNETREPQRMRNQYNDRSGNSGNQVLDAEYTLRLARNKEEKLTFGLNYADNSVKGERSSNRSFYFPDGSPDPAGRSLQHHENARDKRVMDISLDYDKPFRKEGSSLEGGLRLSHKLADNGQSETLYDFAGSSYLPEPEPQNRFRFTETLYAGYASIRTRIGKTLSVRGGLRAEFTDLTIPGPDRSRPYLSLFPTLAVSRYFKKKYHAGLTYGMRINRPGESVLDPHMDNSDPVNISFGNPNLRPSVTHQADLSFGTFGEKWSVSPRLGFAETRDIIERVRTVGSDGVSRTTYENMSGSRLYSFHLSGNFRPGRKIRTTGGLTLSQRSYDTENKNLLKRNGISFRSNLGVSLQLPGRLAFESDLRYHSTTSAQGRNRGSVNTRFSGKKSILNNRLNIRLSATDPFYRQHTEETSEGTNFRLRRSSVASTGNFSLSLSYRFTGAGGQAASKGTSPDFPGQK